jgi:hypothetical protein
MEEMADRTHDTHVQHQLTPVAAMKSHLWNGSVRFAYDADGLCMFTPTYTLLVNARLAAIASWMWPHVTPMSASMS